VLALYCGGEGSQSFEYDAIHAPGVIHGDIRLEKILVTPERNVWIIDFECSRLAGGMSAKRETKAEKHKFAI
jgi:tRNA A-37 threonylcarbamoyl transferase component Bud32